MSEHYAIHRNIIYDWSVRVHAGQAELRGNYSVLIFLGDVPEDSKQWRMADTLVGTSEILAGRSGYGSDSGETIVEGFVYLNQALTRAPIASLEANEVVPYLKDKLAWRVSQRGMSVEFDRVPSLEVTVGCTPMEMEPGDKFPRMGRVVWYHEITAGQPGGYPADSDSA